MMKQLLIQLIWIVIMISYFIYCDLDIFKLNGVITTILLGLWVLGTAMMITLYRTKRM
ncbi:hypothetical protein [Kurthia senegalensis]|uniref:hypothetical protein n=1 Tax=Kurthia senegalensis TaxID=1033740 RepID=UPI000302DEE3|nr:hypothetical protein [Kurthia senegalensis]